jgi:hypothetical protein
VAYVMISSWENASLEQYDELRKVVNWEGYPPDGGIFHVAAHDGNGLRVVDVWETPEHHQRFIELRLMPGVMQLGITGEPRVEVYPAHAIFAPGVLTA